MPFDWKEYFSLAQYLNSGSSSFSSEAGARSAISRAYYAAFCHARNYARDNHGFKPTNKAVDHALVRDHFRNKGMYNIAIWLEDLRKDRNRCDYDDEVLNLSLRWSRTFRFTNKVFSLLV